MEKEDKLIEVLARIMIIMIIIFCIWIDLNQHCRYRLLECLICANSIYIIHFQLFDYRIENTQISIYCIVMTFLCHTCDCRQYKQTRQKSNGNISRQVIAFHTFLILYKSFLRMRIIHCEMQSTTFLAFHRLTHYQITHVYHVSQFADVLGGLHALEQVFRLLKEKV